MKQHDVKEVSFKKERHYKKLEVLEIIMKKKLSDFKLKENKMAKKLVFIN